MAARFAIGIDLGTTNSVLAYTPLDQKTTTIERLSIPQLTAHSQIESLYSLPSFVYIANSNTQDLESISIAPALGTQPYSTLNQISGSRFVVGEFARRSAAENPEQTIVAAKSWLCHRGIDRQAPILPWGAEGNVDLISPIHASRLILEHLIAAWHVAFPDCPISQQHVVLTVPASFDLAARELTFQAAREAGLPENLIALEEPQAAVYHWIERTGDRWRKHLKAGDQIVVCDVGGGTTDLALMQVDESHGDLLLKRIAVGDHLLVGGDNMDLALAHFAAGKFAQAGHKLNAWQSMSLWHAARNAKENLLSGTPQASYPISILGRGSRLIGGTVTTELTVNEVEQVLVEGFFPCCTLTDRPTRAASSGFQEIGLPYESDTAITKHIAAFLSEHLLDSDSPGTLPNRLIFNGGVFKSDALRNRMVGVFNGFAQSPDRETTILGGVEDLDAAVANGAAYYAWTKTHGGLRIRGGTARSYYVGIESAGLAVPGMQRPLTALCVVPKGMEEGSDAEVPSRDIGVIVGQEATFRFFSSSTRTEDKPGTTLKYWDEDELEETSPMLLRLEPSESIENQQVVPVKFRSRITELGMFELWCHSLQNDGDWKLEFSVRGEDDS
jgi:hypothetical protein